MVNILYSPSLNTYLESIDVVNPNDFVFSPITEEELSEELLKNKDLILLDIIDPTDAFDFLYKYDLKNSKSIIVAVAENLEEFVQVELYNQGVNDIIHKPIGKRLFNVKLRENVNRIKCCEMVLAECGIGDFSLLKESFQIETPGGNIKLSKREFEVLELLVENQNEIVSRQELKNKVWKDQAINNRTIDVYIQKLRGHLGNLRIQTVSGKGYKLSK